jgi:hypothetical protein
MCSVVTQGPLTRVAAMHAHEAALVAKHGAGGGEERFLLSLSLRRLPCACGGTNMRYASKRRKESMLRIPYSLRGATS